MSQVLIGHGTAGNELELPFCGTTRHVRGKIFSAKVQFHP